MGSYLLHQVLQAMRRRGHRWCVTAGPKAVAGDAAILHVDTTFVGEEYLALGAHYPVALNFATADISKRRISCALLSRDEIFDGPVIIKSNLNFRGEREEVLNTRAQAVGLPPPYPGVVSTGEYYILPAPAEVTPEIWENPALVVERFLPELDPQGYALRSWVFMGNAERCTRRVSTQPIVKAANCFPPTAVEVPEALRGERARLGFDYGKFDFVVKDGKPVLLDANRTPGKPPSTGATAIARADLLADGLEKLIFKLL